ncbi:NAD-dependent epimerase/dehydratase family protein [Engelhardtia mirabilis]
MTLTSALNPSRRTLLTAAAASAGLALPGALDALARPLSAGAPKRLLVLGGTRFLGPAVVDAALARGWEVTLFNRGQSDPERYAQLETRIGDRDTGDIAALAEGQWDAVVDTSGYVPGHVRSAVELLRDRVGQYVFVSTVSVYADTAGEMIGEDTAVATVEPEVVEQVTTIRESFPYYGAMKALCEQAAEAAMPGRVLNLRPGLIVGPEDSSDRFTYWPVRVARGGEVLAPGDPNAEVQYIDVRDLGEWIVRTVADGTTGVFNAVGFDYRQSFQELLHAAKLTLGADASFTWVGEEFLLEREVAPYRDLPLWLPAGMRGHFDVSRALAAGLELRPATDTIRDTWTWAAARPADHVWRSGIDAAREAELLAAWHAR